RLRISPIVRPRHAGSTIRLKTRSAAQAVEALVLRRAWSSRNEATATSIVSAPPPDPAATPATGATLAGRASCPWRWAAAAARRSEREAAVGGATEGALAIDAVVAKANRPAARTARLNDEIETGATGVGIFGACRLGPHRFDEPVGNDLSHDCILLRGVKG